VALEKNRADMAHARPCYLSPRDSYRSPGTGRVLFAFFAAMAETERENTREATTNSCTI
jgi:DNA invertase Pin-like site-specific DNA recombinase